MKSDYKLAIEEAAGVGFNARLLERAFHLLHLLQSFTSHPRLDGKLALKGGTALNLFLLPCPRLSADIDLNFIGEVDRDGMLKQRPFIEASITEVIKREGYVLRRMPSSHAGGKWRLNFDADYSQSGNLEVDLNFMYRRPLWPIQRLTSLPIGGFQVIDIPVVDIHELAAGKLAALLTRRKARDLFDCDQMFQSLSFNQRKLGLAFVIYGAMSRIDWRTVSLADIEFDEADFVQQLKPMLRRDQDLSAKPLSQYGRFLEEACKAHLNTLLPLNGQEREFLSRLLDHGEIDPSVLTDDQRLRDRIRLQPLLLWKALNVKRRLNLS